jgi:hypothetical protein
LILRRGYTGVKDEQAERPTVKKAFDHIGIVTTTPQPGEAWVQASQVWVTNPRLHPQRIEYVRPSKFPEISPAQKGLWKLWHWPHIAFRVEDLSEALLGRDVVFGPFSPADFLRVAFVHHEGIVVEYMEYADLSHWFGQANPPEFCHEAYAE